MSDRCPLCQGKVIDRRCTECGYDIPDESELESIGSIYNGEPYKEENTASEYDVPHEVPNIHVVSDKHNIDYIKFHEMIMTYCADKKTIKNEGNTTLAFGSYCTFC